MTTTRRVAEAIFVLLDTLEAAAGGVAVLRPHSQRLMRGMIIW
jgi:hypothetical protein